MASFSPATHKLVTAADRDLSTAAPVDGRVALARLLQVAGVADIQFGESSPGDNTKLWYKGSTNVLSRYNPISGAWAALTEAQFSLWLQKRAQAAADNLAALADADTFLVYQNAVGETKKINTLNLKAALVPDLGVGKIVAYWIGYVTTGTDAGQTVYTFTELASKNLVQNTVATSQQKVRLKPSAAITKAYAHLSANYGLEYIGDWAANVEKSFSFNGAAGTPGLMLIGSLS